MLLPILVWSILLDGASELAPWSSDFEERKNSCDIPLLHYRELNGVWCSSFTVVVVDRRTRRRKRRSI